MDVTEEDPNWLKAKGDDFFRSGDIRSALEAYSSAIDADPNMTACYSNRSACFLKLNMLKDCVMDCSEAIKQLQLEESLDQSSGSNTSSTTNALTSDGIAISAGTASLVKLLSRRAFAYCPLGMYAEALADYEGAVRRVDKAIESSTTSSSHSSTSSSTSINSSDSTSSVVGGGSSGPIMVGTINTTTLRADLARIVLLNEADQLKKQGDSILGQGEVAKAAEKYTEALARISVHVGCLSNRSACKMALGDIAGCVADCDEALLLLEMDVSRAGSGIVTVGSDGGAVSGGVGSAEGGIAFGGTPAGPGANSASVHMLAAILPPPGSEKRKAWVMKTVTRRGAAYAKLGRIDEAVADYSLACSLDPKNEALKVDLNKIRNYREGAKAFVPPVAAKPVETEEI